MPCHIHVVNIGRAPEPPLAMFRTGLPIDSVILLNSEPREGANEYIENEREVGHRLDGVGTRWSVVRVDPYDYNGIISALTARIATERSEHPDCAFHFNITAGSNVMAGAMCAMAETMSDSDIYHLRKGEFRDPPSDEDELVMIQIGDRGNVVFLEETPKAAEVMRAASDGEIPHKDLLEATGLSPTLLTYYLKKLTERGLIQRSGSPKASVWSLTPKGEAVYGRYILDHPLRSGPADVGSPLIQRIPVRRLYSILF